MMETMLPSYVAIRRGNVGTLCAQPAFKLSYQMAVAQQDLVSEAVIDSDVLWTSPGMAPCDIVVHMPTLHGCMDGSKRSL